VLDGEHIIIADEAAAFARGCIRLVNDTAYAELLGNSGYDLVTKEFSWGESIRKLVAAYESIALRR
jgi:glycosyltransferase involved in cell wall biosynthesis